MIAISWKNEEKDNRNCVDKLQSFQR